MTQKTGTVTLPWADGEYQFRLAIGEWQEIYRRIFKLLVNLGVPPEVAMSAADYMSVYRRIAGDSDRRLEPHPIPGEVGEIIFQALIGGGMKPQEAAAMRKRYVDDRPQLECIPTAQLVILNSLMGPPEPEAEKKAEAEEAPSSPSAGSTATAQHSATRRKKSTT